MTPSELEAMVKNLNTRSTAMEQILPTLATKDDLKAFATKDDLKAFATKDDLKAFATKDDLKAFATKDDLKAFATKEDLKAFASKDDLRQGLAATLAEAKQFTLVLYEELRGDIRLLAEHLAHVVQVVDRLDRRG